MKKSLIVLVLLLCSGFLFGQNKKQVLDARVVGISSAQECKKIEEQIRKNKEVLNCYTVFKGGESKVTKLVVEVDVRETGERSEIFCSENLKNILAKNGYEMISVKETTLNLNEVYPNYDNRK
jgi:DNA-binding Lrp family transcriptional regulator